VFAGIGESLLHDPVRAASGRHRHGRRIGHPTLQPDQHPGPPRLIDQLGQVGKRRLGPLRRVIGPVVVTSPLRPQHADHLAQFLQRLMGAVADHPRGAGYLVGRPIRAQFQSPGVQAHQGDPVGEHVMHLPGDPMAFVLAGLLDPFGLGSLRPFAQRLGELASGPDEHPPRQDRRDADDAECGLRPVRHRRVRPDEHGADRGEREPGRDQADHREAPVHRHGEQRDQRHAGRGRRKNTEHDGGDREADRPASAQPHTQTAQSAKGDVHGERHRAEIPVKAVDEGERREPHGQQETQGVGDPVARRAPGPG
jgi:hypothetical protein